jgi:hypothetical protein
LLVLRRSRVPANAYDPTVAGRENPLIALDFLLLAFSVILSYFDVPHTSEGSQPVRIAFTTHGDADLIVS